MASERVPLGRHLVKKVWSEEVGVMDYHHWKSPSSPWSRMLIPHSILPNHTEGHRLNGRDVLSRKAGLRLGKDSTWVVGVKNLLRWGSNRWPLEYKASVFTIPPRNRSWLQSVFWSKVDWGTMCTEQQSVLSSKLCWGARCYEEQWVLWSKLCWGEKGYRKQRELGSRVFQREKYSSRQSVLRGKVCYEANCNKPIWSKLFFWAKVNNAKGSQTVKCSGKQSVPQPSDQVFWIS